MLAKVSTAISSSKRVVFGRITHLTGSNSNYGEPALAMNLADDLAE